MSTWWTRNRAWLIALPLVLALLALATSSRYFGSWRHQAYREQVVEAAPGEAVEVDLSLGDGRERFTVELAGVEDRDTVPSRWGDPEPLPEGLAGWVVTLDFSEAVQDDIASCNVILVGEDGTRYGEESSDPWGQLSPCAPEDDDLDEEATSWTATPFVVAPEGAEITEVWLSYDLTRKKYAVLRLP